MAFTYGGDPSNSDLEAVRFLVGDTDSTDQQLQDAEITYLLDQESNVYRAAAAAAKSVGAKYARLVNKAVGDLRIDYQARQKHYDTLAKQLDARANTRVGKPFMGGLFQADKDANDEDTSIVQPTFWRNQFKHRDRTPTEPDDTPNEDTE